MRRRPISTLFPYTTLFRSFHKVRPCAAVTMRASLPLGQNRQPTADTAAAALGEDRKSTRLNSSHSQIPYAAFCSKKKTNFYVRHHDVLDFPAAAVLARPPD